MRTRPGDKERFAVFHVVVKETWLTNDGVIHRGGGLGRCGDRSKRPNL